MFISFWIYILCRETMLRIARYALEIYLGTLSMWMYLPYRPARECVYHVRPFSMSAEETQPIDHVLRCRYFPTTGAAGPWRRKSSYASATRAFSALARFRRLVSVKLCDPSRTFISIDR